MTRARHNLISAIQKHFPMKKSITSNIDQISADNGDGSNKTAEPSVPLDILDPFHPDNLRIDAEYLQQGLAKKLLTTIPVRKPNKQDFIRVHPGREYRLNVALISLQEERETYLVTPKFFAYLEESLRSVHTIYLAINRQKVLFLWPAKLPDSRQNVWHSSALDAAERAMKEWVRVAPNMSLGAYEVSVAEHQTLDPEWPELSFTEILRIAFKGRMVSDPDHPVMQRLRGAI
jgi:hypothetical protein